MEHNYWLHRISHKKEVSYPLLKKGFLSIGFSAFLKNEIFLENMNGDKSKSEKWKLFEEENIEIWGEKYRTRYGLWRFLYEFKEGDIVLIPSWGTFWVYRIIGKPKFAGEAVEDGLVDWNNNVIRSGGEGNRYLIDKDENIIDIGFVIPVEKVVEDEIPRTDYAKNDLLSRMKIRQTNANINDLEESIKTAITNFRNKEPFKIYSETIDNLSESFKKIIDKIVDHDQFEILIKCYFERIGADDVYIPSKQDGEGKADGDIIARFDTLKLLVYVQAKDHKKGSTGIKGIEQIMEYTEQKNRELSDLEYSSISWVISSADEFTKEAQMLAFDNGVKLINGKEFRKMLIDVGMSNLINYFN